jgi:hypothetical protein
MPSALYSAVVASAVVMTPIILITIPYALCREKDPLCIEKKIPLTLTWEANAKYDVSSLRDYLTHVFCGGVIHSAPHLSFLKCA